MTLYRKKPVVIEAIQFTGLPRNVREVHAFMGNDDPVARVGFFKDEAGVYQPFLEIPTLEGVMKARPGDWIIKGVNGEFYPCKNDIFEKTYEEVADHAD